MEFPSDFTFRPTDEVLVDIYLRLKHLGITENRFITDVNISNFDPWHLPFESESDWNEERVWYFYGSEEHKSNHIWKTSSGYWKETGVTIPVIGKLKFTNGIQIGEKKVLVFQCDGKVSKSKSDWVMNEYHATFLPPNQRKYVICKIESKEEGENNNIVSTSIQSTPNQVTDILGEYIDKILEKYFENYTEDDWKNMFDD